MNKWLYYFVWLAVFASMMRVEAQGITPNNVPLDFYGKVVDQNGKPVAGATIKIGLEVGELTPVPNYPQSLLERVRTDRVTAKSGADGTFNLSGFNALGLDIQSIAKDQYKMSKNFRRSYYYVRSAEIFHPDQNNPVVFVLWEEGKRTSLISKDEHYDIRPGESYGLDLETGSMAASSQGDVHFQLNRPKNIKRNRKFDWTFSIATRPGVQIRPIDEDYFAMTFPPADGYTNIYRDVQSSGESSWRKAGSKEFYVKRENRGSFAKMALVWDAIGAVSGPKTNEAGIRIEYTLNPSGSALVQ